MKLVLLALVASCGTDPPQWFADAGDCVAYNVPADFNKDSPVVSFNQVAVVLGPACGKCHGSPDNPQDGLFLGGAGLEGADAATTFAHIVNVMSNESPMMMYVNPGDPSRSYLMHKLDGDQCTLSDKCVSNDCKDTMPQGGSLSLDDRDMIRRWIYQGAAPN